MGNIKKIGNSLMINGVGKLSGVDGVDSSTNSLQIINYSHHEIHSGNHYFITINKDITNSGTYNVAFTTPNTTKRINWILFVNAEIEANVTIQEGITSFTGGTAITPLNSNRNSSNVSGITDMAFDVTPTLGTPLLLGTTVIGSGKNFGGSERGENEIILKQNTKYYISVTNNTNSNNQINIQMSRYEHTNKN